MIALGIVLALLYALTTSFANVLSRRFCIVHQASAGRMLVISHSAMGLMACIAAPLLWTKDVPPLRQWGPDMAFVTFSYMTGQLCMLTGLGKTDSSRVTPLLGLKVFFVALLAWVWTGDSFSGQQWFAVVLSVLATFLLNRAGGRLALSTLGVMILACFLYAACDIRIGEMNKVLEKAGGLRLVLFGASCTYMCCGAVSAMTLPWLGTRGKAEWKAAFEYGVLWLLAAVFLYTAFTLAGVVLTNIVMACRGLTAILIGVLVALAGHHHLEQQAPASVWMRRAGAAALLALAVVLFKLHL
jgi:drug/metabolite transporter (DMT)-like permease